MRLIFAMAGIGNHNAQQRVLQFLENQSIPSSDIEAWEYAFTNWVQGDRRILTDLEKSPNSQVVSIAKAIRQNHQEGKK